VGVRGDGDMVLDLRNVEGGEEGVGAANVCEKSCGGRRGRKVQAVMSYGLDGERLRRCGA